MEPKTVDVSDLAKNTEPYKEGQIIRYKTDSGETIGVVISRKKYEGICNKWSTYAVPNFACNLYHMDHEENLL